MPATYEPIASTTVANSTTTSVTFSSISSAYTDLKVIIRYGAVTSMYLGMRLNSDTGTNYSATRLIGNGGSISSSRQTSADYMNIETNYSPSGTDRSVATIDLFSYRGSTYKTALTGGNSTPNGISRRVSLWRSTSAVTSMTFFDVTSTSNYFTSGTIITLYGIKAA